MCEIYSKSTIKTPKRRLWRRFGVFIVNFEHISHLCSSISVVKFEQVNAGWELAFVSCFPVKFLGKPVFNRNHRWLLLVTRSSKAQSWIYGSRSINIIRILFKYKYFLSSRDRCFLHKTWCCLLFISR